MGESIFSAFEVKLFGRLVDDLFIAKPAVAEHATRSRGKRRSSFKDAVSFGDSKFGQQIKGDYDAVGQPENRLARIYCFAYEGEIFLMPKPTIFLVHDAGTAPSGAIFSNPPRQYGFAQTDTATGASSDPVVVSDGDVLSAANPPAPRIKRSPSSVEQTGVARRDWFFEDDIKMWTYDKQHASIRLDLSAGSFEDILVEATLATMSRMSFREGDMAAREGDMASREGDMASREGDMAARSGDMAFRARHRFR